jgi:hypothetical protein
MPSKQKIDAFVWSAASIFVCVILLSCSLSENFALTLLFDINANRMISDKLQLIAQNALFDLNQYLYHIAGTEIYLVATQGEDPYTLSSRVEAKISSWRRTFNEGLYDRCVNGEIYVDDIKVDLYTLDRGLDVIQLNAIGLGSCSFQEGSVAISASLKIRLMDATTQLQLEKYFRIKIAHPVRLFELHDELNNLRALLGNLPNTWYSENNTSNIAGNVELALVDLLTKFLATLSKKNVYGKLKYAVTCQKIDSNSCRINIALANIELTDLGSYVQLNSTTEHVTLKTHLETELVYVNRFQLNGPDRVQLKNEVEN